MSIIKINNISKSYGTKTLFKNINLEINENEKIGIIGPNGSGKSTLIKILTNNETPDTGNIIIKKNKTLGYLKQATEYQDYKKENQNQKQFQKLNKRLNLDITKNFSTLSGGEKTKLLLSEILSTSPDILILDEPTNHLDLNTVNYIIERLNNYKGTVLVVSHDRYFLNKTVEKIIEIEREEVKVYQGNYESYKYQKEKELKTLKEKYTYEQKQDKKLQKEINKLRNWSEKGEREAGKQGGSPQDARASGVKDYHQSRAKKIARSLKNKKTRLENQRQNYIEKPFETKDIKFSFNNTNSPKKTLIMVENLTKSYDRIVFKDVNLTINTNEKIGLIGPNGSGKTTLIKLLMDKEKIDSGNIIKSKTLKPAYMSQDVFDLKEDQTPIQIVNNYDSDKRQLFFSNLVNLGFDRELFKSKIKNLSLGQRMKIKLVQIILNDYNLLVLDEPTNHLDMENKIELENALVKFPGTIIIASHDKYLLEKVTNKVFVFENQTIKRYEDSYKEYVERR